MCGCCFSGTFFGLTIIKKAVIAEKDSVNLETTHMENVLHSMNNHYSRFPDISALIMPMPVNYHECIIHRE